MKITGSRIIAAPVAEVATILQDGRPFARTVPDFRLNTPLDDQSQRGTLTIVAGPLQGQYEVTFVMAQPETAVFTCHFDGHGAKGIFHGYGRLHLEDQNNQTIIHYAGEIDVAGQLAELPPRLLQANVNAAIRRILEGIDRSLWPDKFAPEPPAAAPSSWLKTAVPAGLLLLAALLLSRLIGKKIHERHHSSR